MRAGGLSKKVTFERHTTTQGTTGAPEDTWSVLGERWASVNPGTGREFWANSGEHSQIDAEIRVRCDVLTVTLQTSDRIKHGANYYDIQNIKNPNSKDRELILLCKLWQSR